MFGYCNGLGVGGWILMIGMWVAFLILVVWAVSRLFPSDSQPDPLDTLDRRLATGQIDPESYESALDDLANSASR
jgi:putative membrane protein